MATDTIPLVLAVDVPVALVEELVRRHLLAALTPNGHRPLPSPDPHPAPTEDLAAAAHPAAAP